MNKDNRRITGAFIGSISAGLIGAGILIAGPAETNPDSLLLLSFSTALGGVCGNLIGAQYFSNDSSDSKPNP